MPKKSTFSLSQLYISEGVCQSDTCHNNTVICNCISHKKVYALQQEHTISMRFDEPITLSLLQKTFPCIFVKT